MLELQTDRTRSFAAKAWVLTPRQTRWVPHPCDALVFVARVGYPPTPPAIGMAQGTLLIKTAGNRIPRNICAGTHKKRTIFRTAGEGKIEIGPMKIATVLEPEGPRVKSSFFLNAPPPILRQTSRITPRSFPKA
jgi:hypothetical protein